jgi:hypothetical protein
MQLLEHTLPDLGRPTRSSTVRRQDVFAFEGAFLANARGIAVVSQLDDDRLHVQAAHIDAIGAAYAAVPWETI